MNSKNKNFKKILSLTTERSSISFQSFSDWTELEQPYKNGYFITFKLRDDISRRQDAWAYQACLDLVNSKEWSRNKNFVKKISKGTYVKIIPALKKISEKTYQSLHPKVKKFFFEDSTIIRSGETHKLYACALSFELVPEISACWTTHVRVPNPDIQSRIAFIDAKLDNSKRGIIYDGYHSSGLYKKTFNRRDRRNSKNIASEIIKTYKHIDLDDIDFPIRRRHDGLWFAS